MKTIKRKASALIFFSTDRHMGGKYRLINADKQALERNLQVHSALPREFRLLSSEDTGCPHYVHAAFELLDPSPLGWLQGTNTDPFSPAAELEVPHLLQEVEVAAKACTENSWTWASTFSKASHSCSEEHPPISPATLLSWSSLLSTYLWDSWGFKTKGNFNTPQSTTPSPNSCFIDLDPEAHGGQMLLMTKLGLGSRPTDFWAN